MSIPFPFSGADSTWQHRVQDLKGKRYGTRNGLWTDTKKPLDTRQTAQIALPTPPAPQRGGIPIHYIPLIVEGLGRSCLMLFPRKPI